MRTGGQTDRQTRSSQYCAAVRDWRKYQLARIAGERGYSEKSGSAAAVDKQQAKLMSSGSIARWIAVNYRRVVGLAI